MRNRYEGDEISTGYLNKYLLKDFERALAASGFDYQVHLIPFGYKLARPLVSIPGLRELCTGYAWFVLTRPAG